MLQTLLQLNILILATPALAGWTLMLPTHSGAIHAACIVWQGRTVAAVAPKTKQAESASARQTAPTQFSALPHLVCSDTAGPADQSASFVAGPAAVLVPSHPFPHAARAP